MINIRLVLEFDGTNYSGWQRQTNGISVEQKVREAIREITSEEPNLIGCSRTDAGVHARKYVCNFKTQSNIPAEKFKFALNTVLNEDIVVVFSEEAYPEFHARFDAKGKKYTYTICNRDVPPAIGRNYAYHYRKQLDIEKMSEAAACLIGRHDFSSFKSSNSPTRTNIRTIYHADIARKGDNVIFSVIGDGFLYNMVRIIAGTLIEIGSGEKKAEDMASILKAKDRKMAGKTAPACGLCLEEVFY